MFRTFLISMFAILLFTLGATGSWFYVNMMEDRKAEAEQADASLPGLPEVPSEANPVPPTSTPEEAMERAMFPAPSRAPGMAPEDIYRLREATIDVREQLRNQEDQLREQKLRIKAADADTKTAQREVEGALEQVRHLLETTEAILSETKQEMEELRKERAALKQAQDKLDAAQKGAGADVATRMKKLSEYMASMPAPEVADTIKEMVNNGKMDDAFQLLELMESRSVAKILAEIPDPQLRAEFFSRFPTAATMR